MKLRNESKQERVDRLERERVEASNRKLETERQRVLVAQIDLDLSLTRDAIAERRKEIAELELRLGARERRLNSAKAKLLAMESAA